ncbi:hypothetical protein E3N88_17512 [Mikania micrantha]|uniref:Uncharacterized protein n=1 Tax=Mikania micrantha TaxID=192012 RepID=A0A5N6NS34_9ASTR|nr:hypothetical protein E3N88_17512 [Mikania micrantha]
MTGDRATNSQVSMRPMGIQSGRGKSDALKSDYIPPTAAPPIVPLHLLLSHHHPPLSPSTIDHRRSHLPPRRWRSNEEEETAIEPNPPSWSPSKSNQTRDGGDLRSNWSPSKSKTYPCSPLISDRPPPPRVRRITSPIEIEDPCGSRSWMVAADRTHHLGFASGVEAGGGGWRQWRSWLRRGRRLGNETGRGLKRFGR